MICAADSAAVAAQIEAQDSLGPYRLVHRRTETIRDTYFDTPGRTLWSRELALRARQLDSTWLITLKGPSHPAGGGVRSRLETEVPWSAEALRITVEMLRAQGIPAPPSSAPAGRPQYHPHPIESMTGLGLEVVQQRLTRRRPIDVVPADKTAPDAHVPLAQLAVDRVSFRLETQEVLLYEVEIEAKSGSGSRAITALAAALTGRFGPALRPWGYGKLATGRAIEALLRSGHLAELLDAQNRLTPAAYDRLEESLPSSASDSGPAKSVPGQR